MRGRHVAFSIQMLVTAVMASATSSDLVRDQHVEARVVGEMGHIQPGQPYRLGLLLKHDEGWHTYWKSTATGYATSVDWELPDGFEVTGLSWPTPKIYEFQGWTEYVYEGEVLLTATVTPPDRIEADSVEIGFSAEWLMCEEVCIPGGASGTLEIPVASPNPAPIPEWQTSFEEADRHRPADPEPAYSLAAWQDNGAVLLQVTGDIPEELTFFDAQALFLADPQAQSNRIDPDTVRIRLTLDDAAPGLPEDLIGVLKAKEGWPGLNDRPGLAVDVPVADGPPADVVSGSPAGGGGISAGLLAIAFLGGLILNLMPCVFPVLGIKIMGFVGHAGASRGKVISHGLIFTAGVLVSFWVLSAVLIALRSGGSQLGWGFQLQSPAFVLALTFLLFAFALNMSGLFEFGQSAVGVGSGLTSRGGLAGSFFSGVLATVVATPCAAPFLAPALGAALTLPPVASFLVFTCIALGLSAPYMVLSAFPALVERLPRPGPWMEAFKQFMSFLLYATVGYLLWVLAGQLTESAGYPPSRLLTILLSLVIVAFALWIFGRWGAFHRRRATRVAATAVALLVMGGALWAGFSATNPVTTEGPAVEWHEWEPGKAAKLAGEGKVVYVDFTARWCVTCQTNKAAVFSSRDIRERFQGKSTIALKADWTNRDPRISEALAAHGRSAVPFNLVYGPGIDSPLVLPEILTPGIVRDALDKASATK